MGDRGDERDGLVLFAGDVFNPSVESAITRGSHMVPILRELKLDASCVGESRATCYTSKFLFFLIRSHLKGNHDFDFGYASTAADDDDDHDLSAHSVLISQLRSSDDPDEIMRIPLAALQHHRREDRQEPRRRSPMRREGAVWCANRPHRLGRTGLDRYNS